MQEAGVLHGEAKGAGRSDASQAPEPFRIGLARAFGGALLFALPLMMTMEMWWLGSYLEPYRLALLLVVMFPLLVGTSHLGGFRETFRFSEDAEDALVAYAVGFIAATALLLLFGVIRYHTSFGDGLGMVALQAVPGSLGALLARSQLGGQPKREKERTHYAGYFGELFLMVVGALFLTLNVAPTEEIILIAFKMTEWHSLALVALSLAIMHTFVYAAGFHGQAARPEGVTGWSLFLRFTVVGYALVLLVCLYVLWTFGRTDSVGSEEVLSMTLVVGFPGAIGAAAARLIL